MWAERRFRKGRGSLGGAEADQERLAGLRRTTRASKRKGYVGVRAKHSDAKAARARRDRRTPRAPPPPGRSRSANTPTNGSTTTTAKGHAGHPQRPVRSTSSTSASSSKTTATSPSTPSPAAKPCGGRRPTGTARRPFSAMFNDAVDDEEAKANPFGNRRAKEQRGRRDIPPLTEAEVDQLADHRPQPVGQGRVRPGRPCVGLVRRVGRHPPRRDVRCPLARPQPPGRPRHRPADQGAANANTTSSPSRAVVIDAIQQMPRLSDLVFPTVSGRRMEKGSLRYYLDPVRSAFRAKVTPERWEQLCEGQQDLDFYVLRHFCASMIVERGGNEYDVSRAAWEHARGCPADYIHEYQDRQRDRLRGLLERPT